MNFFAGFHNDRLFLGDMRKRRVYCCGLRNVRWKLYIIYRCTCVHSLLTPFLCLPSLPSPPSLLSLPSPSFLSLLSLSSLPPPLTSCLPFSFSPFLPSPLSLLSPSLLSLPSLPSPSPPSPLSSLSLPSLPLSLYKDHPSEA